MRSLKLCNTITISFLGFQIYKYVLILNKIIVFVVQKKKATKFSLDEFTNFVQGEWKKIYSDNTVFLKLVFNYLVILNG